MATEIKPIQILSQEIWIVKLNLMLQMDPDESATIAHVQKWFLHIELTPFEDSLCVQIGLISWTDDSYWI